jgi:O-antigen ligase
MLAENKTSSFLSLLLSTILFWTGLGIGENMSDFHFWINNTWMTLKLEWLFIILYPIASHKLPSLSNLLKQYRFVTLISILWLFSITVSYLNSSYYNWNNPIAFMRYFETITHFLFFIFIWDFFTHYKVNYRLIFTAIILSTLVVMLYFMYIHFAFPNLEAEQHVFSIRSKELILNTHLHRIGYQVEASIAFATAFIFVKKEKYLALFFIFVLFIFLLWLGGRAALLGSVITIFLSLFYFKNEIKLKLFFIFTILLVFLLMTTFYFNLLNFEHLMHALRKTFQVHSINHLLTGRIEVWALVMQELNGHWLLGTGPQSYYFYIARHGDVIHAHNFILQMLGEWGILGSSLFFILLFRAIKNGVQSHRFQKPITKPYHFAAGILIFSLTTTGLVGGVYFFTQTSLYLVISFALWTTSSNPKKEEP